MKFNKYVYWLIFIILCIFLFYLSVTMQDKKVYYMMIIGTTLIIWSTVGQLI